MLLRVYVEVAKLADAQGLEPCGVKSVGVQLSPSTQFLNSLLWMPRYAYDSYR